MLRHIITIFGVKYLWNWKDSILYNEQTFGSSEKEREDAL